MSSGGGGGGRGGSGREVRYILVEGEGGVPVLRYISLLWFDFYYYEYYLYILYKYG